MASVHSLVHQQSTSTGTGNFTLATVNGKQSFDTAFGHGATTDVFYYFISNQSAAEYEWGTGHMSDATTLVRDTVIGSSNSNAAVSFSAGTKDVACDIPAKSQISFDDAAIVFRNLCLNGGFDIWQRGAGDSASIAVAASTTAYTADRWYLSTGANQACTVSAQTGLANRSRNSAQVQRNSGQTGTGVITFGYPLTKDECIRFRGRTISLQFLTATGANWSPTSGTLTANVYFGTGAEGKRGAGFTGETNPLSTSVNLATGASAAQSTASSSGTVATNVTQGELQFTFTPTGTAGANDWVQLDDVQIEGNAAPSAFEYLPFDLVLHEMQRHAAKTFPYNTAPAQSAGVTGALQAEGGGTTGTPIFPCAVFQFPVPMRIAPTITTYNPSAAAATWRDVTGSSNLAVTVDPSSAISADRVFIVSAAGLQQHALAIHVFADAGL